MNSYAKILGLVPYDCSTPNMTRARETFWNAEDERLLMPTFFGVGWTLNLGSAPLRPLQALPIVAFIIWRLRARRNPGQGR